MQFCAKCVYPAAAVNTVFDADGVCSACRSSEEMASLLTAEFWQDRRRRFEQLAAQYRGMNEASYDCIIPVSGGKDSYWQAYLVKHVYGMKPLLVTYHGNNYLPEGQGNLDRMRDVLGIDHVVFGPSVDTLRKLNRIGFEVMGDMNWHAHAGIKIVPLRAAVQFHVPLLVWGEITWTVAGMFSADDYVEYNKRTVQEHDLRGYSWKDFVGREGLTAQDLMWLRFPSDEDLARINVRGVYVGNYFKWDPNVHAQLMRQLYQFEFARQPFERTYRMMSNLDDMHENGLHDYMKFIKFGYGRASDHASKDIRDGYLTRAQGIALVEKYDHVKPRRDLERWLDYVGMNEADFDRIADGFRNPRVWWIKEGQWWKTSVSSEPKAYGPVHLSDRAALQRYRSAPGFAA